MTDHNERAKRGQALNLAVHSVNSCESKDVADREDYRRCILEEYLFFYNLSTTIQELSIEEIKGALDETA